MAKTKAVAAKAAIVPVDPHSRLVNDILPKALDKMDEILSLPFKTYEEDENGVLQEKLNTRILSMQHKTAAAVVQSVVHIEDLVLKRKAGTQIDKLLARMKEEKPELFNSKTIEG